MPQKVLVVDDDNATLLGLLELLRGAGYQAVGARTLATAKKALIEESPDLLIADVRLDAFNGLQLVATNPRPIPVIVITGYPDPTLEAEARRLGAEFVLKPVLSSNLLHMVAQKLAKVPDTATNSSRRWARRAVSKPIVAQVDDGPARIVDVSYGGLCLEIRRTSARSLPGSLGVTFPSAALSIDVAVVWQKLKDDASWVCGGMVRDDQPEWRQLVDALS